MRGVAVLCALVLGSTAMAQDRPSPVQIIDRFNADCSADDGALWGVTLCGPILLVDKEAGKVHASQRDADGLLQQGPDGLWHADLPEASMPPYTDTATTWSGTRWAMARYVPQGTSRGFARTALHESFHRIQPELPFSPAGVDIAPHLDEAQGRLWLRLSLRAASNALASQEEAQFRQHLHNAVLFTLKRYALYEQARETELAMEMHEGLAEYTGWRLAGEDDAAVSGYIDTQDDKESYARSFPYATGLAWGYMLDRAGVDWRPQLGPEGPGFADMARAYLGETTETDMSLEELASQYGYTDILEDEKRRAEKITALRNDYERRFVTGQRLITPLTYINFDPNSVMSLGDHGEVYGTLKNNGPWGTLETERGALVVWSTGQVIVDWLDGAIVDGDWQNDFWRLELNEGWSVEKRDGDLYVIEG